MKVGMFLEIIHEQGNKFTGKEKGRGGLDFFKLQTVNVCLDCKI